MPTKGRTINIRGILPNLTDPAELNASIQAVFGKTIKQIVANRSKDAKTYLMLAYILWSVQGIDKAIETLGKGASLQVLAEGKAYATSQDYKILKFRQDAGRLLRPATATH
jgi:hypothetical protein